MSYAIEPIDLASIPENAVLERFTVAQIKARFPLLAGKKKGIHKGDTKPLQTAPRLTPANRPVPMTALQRACEKVAQAPEGQRDDTLNKQAFFVAQRLASGLLNESEREAKQALAEAARQAGLEESEIAPKLDSSNPTSAFSKGALSRIGHYEIAGGHIEYSPSSVWFVPEAKKEGQEPPPPLLLARQLEVAASTLDVATGQYGFRLCGKTDKGRVIDLILPRSICTDGGNAVAAELADAGFQIEPLRKQKELLAAHLLKCPVDAEQRFSPRLGWHGDTYLLPDKAIAPEGSEGERLMYRNDRGKKPDYGTQGTLDEWRQQVAAKAQGNTRLILALCAGFAAPLLKPSGEEQGGFTVHLRGCSGTGKSTALHTGASIWGKPSAFRHAWRTTDNALEAIAEGLNDNLLAIDELGQCRPKAASEAAYMLAQGEGKERVNGKTLKNAPTRFWRCIVLSTGELSLTALLETAGFQVKVGQLARFFDVEADAGQGMGLFECLNGHSSATALAEHLEEATKRYHGTAGEAFLQCVANEYGQIADGIPAAVEAFAKRVTPEGASGQVYRAAKRFGLLAAAGELATQYGITGWQQGEASDAIATCFAAWLEGFGTGNREQQQALSDIRALFAMYGDSRFDFWQARDNRPCPNRLGYWRYTDDGDQQFIVLPELFSREICKGHDDKVALKALLASGAMVANNKGSATHAQRVDKASKPVSVYIFSANGLGIPIRPKDRYTLDHAATAAANEPAKPAADIASAPPASQVPNKEEEATASDPTYFAQKPLPLKQQPAEPRKPDNPTAASLQAQRPLGTITISGKAAARPIPKAAPPQSQNTAEQEPPDTELLRQEHQRQIWAEAAAAEAVYADYL